MEHGRLCGAGCMSLAFTQEDFLVFGCSLMHTRKLIHCSFHLVSVMQNCHCYYRCAFSVPQQWRLSKRNLMVYERLIKRLSHWWACQTFEKKTFSFRDNLDCGLYLQVAANKLFFMPLSVCIAAKPVWQTPSSVEHIRYGMPLSAYWS